MDTFEEYYVNGEENTQKEKTQKRSPFADSPYENPFDNSVIQESPKKDRAKGAGRKILAVVCAVAILIGCCSVTALVVGGTFRKRLEKETNALERQLENMQQRLDELEKQDVVILPENDAVDGMSPGQIYASVAESVVCIIGYDDQGNGSSGSGFIYSEDGYVITNYHVVSGMTELTVVLNDKSELEAELVGYEASADIAVLKVEEKNLPSADIGSSDALSVGARVVAIGYPLSSDTASMTVGYISAKDQVISTDGTVSNMLQTDAAINSGNSGGPLFNAAGQVVGITTSKFSGYSSSGVSIEGMGFAIPMDDVVQMIEDLCEYGYITGAYLGVYVRDVDTYVQQYGLPAGAYVDEAMEGLAADKGGIKAGDVIIKLEGNKISSVADLTLALRRFNAGDEVSVTVWRNGKEVRLSVVLEEKPVEETVQTPEVTTPQEQEDESAQWEDWFLYPFFGPFADKGE